MAPITESSKFKVIIVGGGITGLTTAIACREKGFEVTIVEASKVFKEVGAGLFLAASASHILSDLGLRTALEECTTEAKKTLFVSFDGSAVLSEKIYNETELGPNAYPHWQLHRADLHTTLLDKAQEVGTTFVMGATVKKYNPETPSLFLEDGSEMRADVILAADGYRSAARAALLGEYKEPIASGKSAYRAVIPCELLKNDPSLAPLLDWTNQTTYVWVGDGKHVVAYPIRQGEYYNIGLIQSAVGTQGSDYVVSVDPQEVLEEYKGWDPRLLSILKNLPPSATLEWRLCYLDPLESWVFPSGKIVLLGDACHAMLPSAAQGAGMGIEDGSAIAELLARAQDAGDIPRILKTFESLRLPRCTAVMQGGSADLKKWQGSDADKAGVTTLWSWDYDVKKIASSVELASI